MSLRPRPAGAFVLEDRETWDDNASIVDAWRLPSIPLAELDLNRAGAVIRKPRSHAAFKGRKEVLDHFHAGFDWQGGDAGTSRWVPQGLTGSADSSDADVDGRRWLAVSWHNEHDDVEHGMRMSFADVTEWATPIRYRHVLLVKPEPADDPSARATFSAIPAHAGGVVWFRNYLYVTDSRGFDSARPGGLLVFDMRQIKEVDDSRSDAIGWSQADEAYYAFGYRYVLPQVGQYVQKITDKGTPLRWSLIGLDRTGATRSLVMGEYSTRQKTPARLVWWKLDRRTGRLAAGGGGRLRAALARSCSDERFLQGCHSDNALNGKGSVWLSRSSGADALYERPIGGGRGKAARSWADQPDGLTYAPDSGNLWCVTERAGARAVFAVERRTL